MEQFLFPASHRIFSEGDAADCAYLVEDGWVEILAENGDRQKSLSMIGPGEIFGEMGVIDGSPRSATAVAAENCRLLRVSAAEFHALLGRHEPFHAELLGKVVARFRDAQKGHLSGTSTVRKETSELGPGYAMLARYRDIAAAIDRGEIEAFLQPIVDLATGRWRGFEALARWRSPETGLRPAGEFLPLAERTGLIRRIDLVIAEQAMRACQSMAGPRMPYINLNFSAWHFRDDQLVPTLAAMLERTGIDPGRVRVELTESLMLDDPDAALREMTRLAGLGLKLALDDFGTGYSSLSVLHRMPIDILKLDRALASGFFTRDRQRSVLRNVVSLARELGMEVVVEGVEDHETAAALLTFGCTIAQGFLFARPMPAAEATAAWPTASDQRAPKARLATAPSALPRAGARAHAAG